MWNKFVFGLENFLRRSWLAGILPVLRERSPSLHRTIILVQDRIFPYKSTTTLSRYQYRAIRHFLDLASRENALDTVLEIGSDLAGKVITELKSHGARTVVGLNPQIGLDGDVTITPMGEINHLLRSDARWIPLEDGSVSSAFSVATFEHIHGLDVALDEMFRVLRPGGILYSDFGPIWSCSVGHHVYAKVGDEEARHWKPGKNPIPNYGHLLFSPDELREQLKDKVSLALLDAIVHWTYEDDGINRLFFEDYVEIFQESNFQILAMEKVLEHINPEVENSLQKIYAPHREFRCRMLEVTFRKPG